jgi:hypothetical protein
LPSGRYQARYRGPNGVDHPAPNTFATKTDAERWLARTEVEIHDDHWRDPDLGRVSFGEYATAWIKERPGLRPNTVQVYQYVLRRTESNREPLTCEKNLATSRWVWGRLDTLAPIPGSQRPGEDNRR